MTILDAGFNMALVFGVLVLLFAAWVTLVTAVHEKNPFPNGLPLLVTSIVLFWLGATLGYWALNGGWHPAVAIVCGPT